MAQAILTKVVERDGKIELTFIDLDKTEHTGLYTGNLTVQQLRELTGTQIAFKGNYTEKEQANVSEITRAWDTDKNSPVYSSEEYAGDDGANGRLFNDESIR